MSYTYLFVYIILRNPTLPNQAVLFYESNSFQMHQIRPRNIETIEIRRLASDHLQIIPGPSGKFSMLAVNGTKWAQLHNLLFSAALLKQYLACHGKIDLMTHCVSFNAA